MLRRILNWWYNQPEIKTDSKTATRKQLQRRRRATGQSPSPLLTHKQKSQSSAVNSSSSAQTLKSLTLAFMPIASTAFTCTINRNDNPTMLDFSLGTRTFGYSTAGNEHFNGYLCYQVLDYIKNAVCSGLTNAIPANGISHQRFICRDYLLRTTYYLSNIGNATDYNSPALDCMLRHGENLFDCKTNNYFVIGIVSFATFVVVIATVGGLLTYSLNQRQDNHDVIKATESKDVFAERINHLLDQGVITLEDIKAHAMIDPLTQAPINNPVLLQTYVPPNQPQQPKVMADIETARMLLKTAISCPGITQQVTNFEIVDDFNHKIEEWLASEELKLQRMQLRVF